MNNTIRTALLFAAALAVSGCLRAYSVTAGAEEGHYVVVMQKAASGQMKVYDCRSEPTGTWEPECRKVNMK